jgi:hypothetical protein
MRDYGLPPVFYVDPRPVGAVTLVVTDPYVTDNHREGFADVP